jgi:O-antigen/teichoic acid export membrane protein
MSEIVDQSLIKIVKGTGLVFFGTVMSMPLTFASKLIIIRYTTTTEYGMYALAMVVLNILCLIALLGLQEGVARYIAYYHGKKEDTKIRNTIFFSVKTTLITSALLFLILFIFSDVISTQIFHNPEFSTPLRLFSLAVPFLVLIDVVISFFRGFGSMRIFWESFMHI